MTSHSGCVVDVSAKACCASSAACSGIDTRHSRAACSSASMASSSFCTALARKWVAAASADPPLTDEVAGAGAVQRPAIAGCDVGVHRLPDQVVGEEHVVVGGAEQSVVDAFADQHADLRLRQIPQQRPASTTSQRAAPHRRQPNQGGGLFRQFVQPLAHADRQLGVQVADALARARVAGPDPSSTWTAQNGLPPTPFSSFLTCSDGSAPSRSDGEVVDVAGTQRPQRDARDARDVVGARDHLLNGSASAPIGW